MARSPRLSTIPEGRRFPCLWFRSTSHGKATAGIRNTRFCVVNTQDGVNEMIETIMSQARPPVLYMAREGSLLTLHVHPEPDCSFIVDLEALGASAFVETSAQMTAAAAEGQNGLDESNNRGQRSLVMPNDEANDEAWHQDSRGPSRALPSLKTLLESSCPPKVLFNARGLSDFLSRRFEVTLGGDVEEIQRLELETRTSAPWDQAASVSAAGARSLRRCLEEDSGLPLAQVRLWLLHDRAMAELKNRDEGGGGDDDDSGSEFEGAMDSILNVGGAGAGAGGAFGGGASSAWMESGTDERLLPEAVVLYCVEQVRHLPGLRGRYLARLGEAGRDAAG